MRYKKSIISWENLIPSHWKEIKGKYLFTNEKEIIGDKWNNEQRISLTYDGVIPRDNEDLSGLNPKSLATYQVVKENDLLFKLIDLENEKTSRVGLSSYNGITSSAYIRVNVNDMYPRYYFYWYYSLWFRFIYNRLGNGVRSTLNAKDLLDLFVPVPPKEEQIKLSEIIQNKTNKIDTLIDNQQQQIEKLKEYKQSLISEVVIKGLDSNVETKDSGVDWIGRVPTNTAIVQLGKIASLKTGTTPKGNVGINQEYDGINWYTPGDFTSLILSSSEKYISSSAIIDNKIKIYEKNSILFVGIGATAGKLGLSTVECYSNQQITQIYPKNIDAKYLLYFMASQTQILRDRALYTTLPIINNSYLKTIFIPVPSANDQVYICSYIENKLRQIDNLLDIKNKKIHYLNNYKKSLIYEYVTGKKEVS